MIIPTISPARKPSQQITRTRALPATPYVHPVRFGSAPSPVTAVVAKKLPLWQKAVFFPPLVIVGLGAHVWAYGLKGFKVYFKQLFQSWHIATNAQRAVENFLLFPRWAKSKFKIAPSLIKITGFDKVDIEVSKGIKVHGNYLPASHGKPTIVFAYGNGMSLEDTHTLMIEAFKKDYGIVTFDYPGYGDSTGFPSEDKMYEAFQAVSHYLSHTLPEGQRVPLSNQIAMGESIGGAAAINAAYQAERNNTPYKGLIACSTFTDMHTTAGKVRENSWQLKFIPQSLIEAMQPFDSLTKISNIKTTPTIIAHGNRDNVIPHEMGQSLYGAVKSPSKEYWLAEGKAHCDLMQESEAIETILSKFEKLTSTT